MSSAIVTGLKSLPGETTPAVVSPRNEEIAAELAALFGRAHCRRRRAGRDDSQVPA